MATRQQKEHLMDTLRGPRYYRLTLNGMSCRSNYVQLTKEAYDYWRKTGVDNLVDYAAMRPDNEYETFVPPEADFLCEKGLGEKYAFFHDESPHTVMEQHGAYVDDVCVTIEEIEDERWEAKNINTIVEGMHLEKWIKKHNPTAVQMAYITERHPDYYVHFVEEESDDVFCGIFETLGDFDPNKLQFEVREYWNGENTIEAITYADDYIFNDGWTANPQGFYATLYIRPELSLNG